MDTPDELKVVDGSRTLLIQKQAFDDTVVWNQWIEKVRFDLILTSQHTELS
jgi:D-hexose-6-phosphate mutarotase